MKKPTFLDNQFKGLQVDETRPNKPFPVFQSMLIVFVILALLHWAGCLQVSNTGGI